MTDSTAYISSSKNTSKKLKDKQEMFYLVKMPQRKSENEQ